jgi:REP element-mobilizing transposase RayT
MPDELRRGRSVVFSLSYHLVFVTKYRKHAIASERVRECLRLAFESVCADLGGTLKECDGEDDHMHLLVEMPPKIAPSVMVNSLKGVSPDCSELPTSQKYAANSGRSLLEPQLFRFFNRWRILGQG